MKITKKQLQEMVLNELDMGLAMRSPSFKSKVILLADAWLQEKLRYAQGAIEDQVDADIYHTELVNMSVELLDAIEDLINSYDQQVHDLTL